MKKWIITSMLLFLLSACSPALDANEQSSEQPSSDPAKNSQTDQESENQSNQLSEITEGEEEINEEMDEGVSGDHSKVTPQYYVDSTNYSVKPIDDAEPSVVLLTIDDAPDKYALDMAKILKELNVKAIFFVNGHFIETEEKKAVLKEIHDMGFPIGNHTMTHKSLNSITEEDQYEEIMTLNDRIEEIIGEKPRFFRAPFGGNTDYAKDLAAKEGMILMNWTYGYDWEPGYMEASALKDIMINTEALSNGANLLMHDREWTKDALSEIVIGLQNKGYKILDPDLIGNE